VVPVVSRKLLPPLSVLFSVLLLALASPTPGSPQDPVWLSEVSSLPEHTPPFQVSLSTGSPIRMIVAPGAAYRIQAAGGLRIYGVLEGEITHTPATGPGGSVYLYHSHVECGQMVFDPREDATLEVDTGPMVEKELAAGDVLDVPIEPGGETVGRFVNLHQGESAYQYEFYLGESSVSEAPEDFRTITLDGEGDVDRKNWKADADRVVIRVLKGRIQVKAGQPFQR